MASHWTIQPLPNRIANSTWRERIISAADADIISGPR
jgi:hypothetical protein